MSSGQARGAMGAREAREARSPREACGDRRGGASLRTGGERGKRCFRLVVGHFSELVAQVSTPGGRLLPSGQVRAVLFSFALVAELVIIAMSL